MLLFIVWDNVSGSFCGAITREILRVQPPRRRVSSGLEAEFYREVLDPPGHSLNLLWRGCKLEIYGTATLIGERDVHADGSPIVECDTRHHRIADCARHYFPGCGEAHRPSAPLTGTRNARTDSRRPHWNKYER